MAATVDTTRRDSVLSALHKTDGKTFSEIGELSSYLIGMAHEGWIVKAGLRSRKGGGRPANVWKLTDKGRKKAGALAKKGARS
jgi:predicted transcriptional regulator